MKLVDIGSSTVKVYDYSNGSLEQTGSRSFHFKEGFSQERGLAAESKKSLFNYINTLDGEVRAYATSIFRQMSEETLEKFSTEFEEATGAEFNLVTQSDESEYIEAALLDRSNLQGTVVIVNIGGGSTELVFIRNGERVAVQNAEMGVGTLIQEFPEVNHEFSGIELDEIVVDVKKRLAGNGSAEVAFYTGGELTYMERCSYPLQENDLFRDDAHPCMITVDDFRRRNREIFSEMSLAQLKERMPENPRWMEGARPCSALAQAIFEKYGVHTIIPSDSNMIDGVVRKELA